MVVMVGVLLKVVLKVGVVGLRSNCLVHGCCHGNHGPGPLSARHGGVSFHSLPHIEGLHELMRWERAKSKGRGLEHDD
jgi:hypothetical protein